MTGNGQENSAVLVLYNRPAADSGESDHGVLDEVAAVTAALQRSDIPCRAAGARRLEEVLPLLQAGREKVVFNLVESFPGGAEEAVHVPSICLALGRSCTGSSTPALALTLDKVWTRAVLADAGLPVPPGCVLFQGQGIQSVTLPAGPLIVKPAKADASEGISVAGSVVSGPGPELERAVAAVHERFGQPALIEALVGERELNVSMVDLGSGPVVLPLAEIDFSRLPAGSPPVVDYAAKWDQSAFSFHNTPRLIPAPLDGPLADEIRRLALSAWQATGCTGYARVDLRLANNRDLFILEVNANPDISPDAGFAAALQAAGIGYQSFVTAMVAAAAGNTAETAPAVPDAVTTGGQETHVTLRQAEGGDRERVMAMLHEAGVFRPEECLVGEEVFQDGILRGPASGYFSLVAETNGLVRGWLCHGPVPCAVATHDIYWIVTASGHQGRGIGSALLRRAEEDIRQQGARLIAVETSGSPLYAPTRSFYLRHGYTVEAILRDFYQPGDDKVILTKRLESRTATQASARGVPE